MNTIATSAATPGSPIVMAPFATHEAADGAVPQQSTSVVDRDSHNEEQPIGYFNAG